MNEMMVGTGNLLSDIVTWTFALLGIWGLWAFFPRKNERNDTGAAWLILAIWLGFLGNTLNNLYWRVFGDILVNRDILTIEELVAFGQGAGDILWKSIAAVSIYLHFYARYKSIPKKEQNRWTPLLMGFYPNDGHWAYKACQWRRSKHIEAYQLDHPEYIPEKEDKEDT